MNNLIDKLGTAIIIYYIILLTIFLIWFISLIATILIEGYTKKINNQLTYLNENINKQNMLLSEIGKVLLKIDNNTSNNKDFKN